MYLPSNIRRSEDFPREDLASPHHLYRDCFGKFEYEVIAQRLVEFSQQRGDWVALRAQDFVSLFDHFQDPLDRARYSLNEMADESRLLTRKRGRFSLTPHAIEKLVQRYPSERQSPINS